MFRDTPVLPLAEELQCYHFPVLVAENQMSNKYFESKKSISQSLLLLGKNLSTLQEVTGNHFFPFPYLQNLFYKPQYLQCRTVTTIMLPLGSQWLTV